MANKIKTYVYIVVPLATCCLLSFQQKRTKKLDFLSIKTAKDSKTFYSLISCSAWKHNFKVVVK